MPCLVSELLTHINRRQKAYAAELSLELWQEI